MEEIQGVDRLIMAGLLLVTLAGPLVALITLAFSTHFRKTLSGQIVFYIALYAALNGSLGVRYDIDRDLNFNDGGIVLILHFMNLVFLLALVAGSGALGQMGKDGTSLGIRITSFLVLMLLIPMGFASLAVWIDGGHGMYSTMQYYAEFIYRMADVFSFGYLSNFNAGGYSRIVVYTHENSWSVILFNIVMGLFVFSSLVQIIRPQFGLPQKRFDTESTENTPTS